MIPRLEPSSKTEAIYLDFLSQLGKVGFVGEIQIDHGDRCVQGTDNSIYQMLPQGAVYPHSTDDLVILCELVSQKQYCEIVLAPRGGGTGTNGQSLTDGIVVDLSRHMNSILEINIEESWVRVQSGVVKDQLNAALKPHGLFFAPELSTSNRATIGGMINTDASGQGSCVYGKTRDHVLELQTVLLDGSVLHSQALAEEEFISLAEQQNKSGLIHRVIDSIQRENRELIEATFPKLNRCLTGYDLAHIRDQQGQFNLNNILCGSEGTLGFITEAKLNVLPIPKATALVVIKYGDFEASLRDATELMSVGPTSIETIDSKVLSLAMQDFIWSQVEEFFTDETPVPVKGINFAEYTADSDAELSIKMEPLLKELQATEFSESSRRIGFAIASGREAVNKIWAMRKRAVGLLGNGDSEERPVPFVEDTAVPPEHLADFIMEFREILDGYELQYGMFGHVDAGVLHVRPALDMKDPDQETMAWEISDRIADLCHQYHGLLWGEHGKGVRSDYSPKFFGDLYPQLQRVKAVFDPNNQLNPGKIATPDDKSALFKINEVPTRGQSDRTIAVSSWNSFEEAVYCNGNGACYNWNPNDAMCPSWKATRKRTHSPKGRASLIREWLRLLSENDTVIGKKAKAQNIFTLLVEFPKKFGNSRRAKKGEFDYSHEVYDSMSACLACKSCTGQCPIKVDVPEFRSKFLSHYHSRYLRPLKDHLVANLENILPLAAMVPWLYNPVMSNGLVRWFLRTHVGFVDAPLISYAKIASAGIEFAKAKKIAKLTEEEKSRTVVIVQDAFTRYFETPLIIDLFQFLRALGFNPLLAPYKPNGKPLHVHGFLNRFTKVAEKNSRMLSQLENAGVALIGVDPSMTLTYRSEYSKHKKETNTLPKVQLIQEWLSGKTDALNNARLDDKQSYTLALHCTEKTNATASSKQWQSIFSALGQELKIIELGCCGMAGTFGHEAANREISKDLYNISWRAPVNLHSEGNNSLLATGYSCRSQAKRESGAVLQHPIQALIKRFTDLNSEGTI